MDPIKSVTTEFHYASIYDDVKTSTTGTSQDVSRRDRRSVSDVG